MTRDLVWEEEEERIGGKRSGSGRRKDTVNVVFLGKGGMKNERIGGGAGRRKAIVTVAGSETRSA